MKAGKRSRREALRGFKLLHYAVTLLIFVGCVNWRAGAALEGLRRAICGAYAVALFLLERVYDVYSAGASDNARSQAVSTVVAALIAEGLMALVGMPPLDGIALLMLCAAQYLWHWLWSRAARQLYARLLGPRRTAVVYRAPEDLRRVSELRRCGQFFDVQKYIENPGGDFTALARELEDFDAVIVAGIGTALRNDLAKYCVERGVQGYFAPRVGDIVLQGGRHMRGFSVPVMRVGRADPRPEYLLVKRTFDIVASAAALALLSPLLALAALCVKLYDRGPVLYRQVRLTRDGRRFEIMKFRSMRIDAEKDGVPRLASAHDDRVTPVGRWMRACRADELPQLWNILKGEMSFVGPRPERPEIAEAYARELPAFALRLQVKAGLTGFAQVYGRYDTTPYDKLQMDLMYINRMGVLEDLRLMFATVRVLCANCEARGVKEERSTAGAEEKSAA